MCYSCGCSCGCTNFEPCGCYQSPCQSCINTTSTTTTTTLCPDAIKCDEYYDCECVIYNGPNIECYDLQTGDNLCKILETIIQTLSGCETTQPPLECDFTATARNTAKYCNFYDNDITIINLG